MFPKFTVKKNTPYGRLGTIFTAHGNISTPSFFFCATKATIKGVDVWTMETLNTPVILANTYHLMLQPGAEVIAKSGSVGTFMGWSGPTYTDSGGYQIFSLGYGCVSQEIKGSPRSGRYLKISENGATFLSYRDGSTWCLTPELSIHVQQALGADCIFTLDECTPYHISYEQTRASMEQSHRWAKRSLTAFLKEDAPYKRSYQGLYGISQGGIYPDLRCQSVDFLNSMPFFGHGIGGSLGKTSAQMREVLDMALENLCPERPIHLLGIGKIQDIFDGIAKGIDTFDCVIPTRLGRHGGALIRPHYWSTAHEAYHSRASINLLKACFKNDHRPIDETCTCPTCQRYTRAYLHHLMKSKEISAGSALTIHNVFFMNSMMEAIRDGIALNSMKDVRLQWVGD
ncbi:queuine tRNA-ribosyltransferase [Holospora obtusa F1]|uniref:Queuine tRNA-ribosyltransferase n=1 Tax=Holospora obtusa F1 TaxID=1399147 RepID=W6TDZ8_HOLOB|nr:tRNA guanosine(34) transglycosylase Tgt [Holospora obtusa]ETZ06844.1 queuine tRNA-ribosyltransferase [Holospora obtusa F1]